MGHKSTLGKFKNTEIISSIFSDHNAMRLDINYKKKSVKNKNTWRLNKRKEEFKIDDLVEISVPYKFSSREFKKSNTVIKVKDVEIGGKVI